MYTSLMTELLGGKKTTGLEVRTPMDLVELSRKGVSKASLLYLAEYMGSPVGKMAVLLPVTERTIQRYGRKDLFNRVVSESILHVAEVVARGVEIFEDKEIFLGWLRQPSEAMGGRTPVSLLNSRYGASMVLDELTRIEHGVVS